MRDEIEITQTRAGRWSAWRNGRLIGWTATRDGGRSWQVYIRRDHSQQEGELVDSASDRDAAVAALRREARREEAYRLAAQITRRAIERRRRERDEK